jgi:hypothetical protein
MGSRFDDWVYWHFFTVTTNYYTSQLILIAEASLHSASPYMSPTSQSQSHTATDGQSASLGVEPILGLMTRYLLLFDSYCLVFVRRPL